MTELENKLSELEAKRTWLEAQLDKVTSLDERLALLTQVNLRILEALQAQIPQPIQPTQEIAPYFTKYFPLDSARINEEIQVSGNTLLAFSDGNLSECLVRLDSPLNDSISLLEFNGAYLGAGFEKLYLTTSAQTGKYLRLLIIRGVGSSVAGINIQAQSAGIFLQPEWSARQDIDKSIRAYATNEGFEQSASTSYVVPTDKTLYIVSVSFIQHVNTATNYDHHLWGECHLIDNTSGTTLYKIAGNGGGNLVLPKPAVISGGNEFLLYIINYSNITCYLDGVALGYEL